MQVLYFIYSCLSFLLHRLNIYYWNRENKMFVIGRTECWQRGSQWPAELAVRIHSGSGGLRRCLWQWRLWRHMTSSRGDYLAAERRRAASSCVASLQAHNGVREEHVASRRRCSRTMASQRRRGGPARLGSGCDDGVVGTWRRHRGADCSWAAAGPRRCRGTAAKLCWGGVRRRRHGLERREGGGG